MAIDTQRKEAYLVMKDSRLGDLHIPMNIITDAITDTADADFDAGQIEAHIRNSMAGLGSPNAETAVAPSSEEISLENVEADRSLGLVIDGEMYRVDTDQFKTLRDLAIWMSETLNQAKERAIAAYTAKLEADLEKAGFLQNNITLKIKM